MRLTHKQEYKDKRKNREPMLKIRNKLFNYENVEEKHKILSLDDLDNRLTALEIIQEKDVNLYYFKSACATMNYEQYLSMWNTGYFVGIQMTSKTMLTQEEYELLKRYCYDKEN